MGLLYTVLFCVLQPKLLACQVVVVRVSSKLVPVVKTDESSTYSHPLVLQQVTSSINSPQAKMMKLNHPHTLHPNEQKNKRRGEKIQFMFLLFIIDKFKIQWDIRASTAVQICRISSSCNTSLY